MWNPKSWPLGLGIQLKESGILLTIGNHNPSSTAKNGVQFLESGIHGVESRIQLRLSRIPFHRANHIKISTTINAITHPIP